MQKIFVNDYELPTSPRSSQPENIPPRNFKEEIPPRNFNSNPIRSKSLRLERRNKSSDLNREFEVANAYLQMPGLIGLQKNYKDPVQVLHDVIFCMTSFSRIYFVPGVIYLRHFYCDGFFDVIISRGLIL